MKPALSVVFFTTVSGAGWGMLFWLGVLDAASFLPDGRWFGPVAVGVAMALASAGLLASTRHLGRPERAWRALSQWRSSWLSREGVAALAAYLPAIGFAAAWLQVGPFAPLTRALGLLGAVVGCATVVCTAMIYRCLTPVRQWHNGFVLPTYLLLAAYSGAACLSASAAFWQPGPTRLAASLAAFAGIAGAACKRAYWRFIDRGHAASTIESATGLGTLGAVRMLEAPHTEENYLMREMGFRIARKHAGKLRRVTFLLGFAAPVMLLAIGAALGGIVGQVILPLAALCVLAGLYVERWLFFAQATHTVTLYYGRPD
ncbi:MAG TPA: DmsC/YnfH family molybdoenzyme membrane anchor subunit [Acetobacteraceae bacterium]|nr:DmsC/YnfH family molybdoenzyme membrane anchor subunit [Acetobacteraceae bacterium]